MADSVKFAKLNMVINQYGSVKTTASLITQDFLPADLGAVLSLQKA